MFKFDENRFFHDCHEGHGHFPPHKPRYTMTEEVEHTARMMQETIDRLLKFEERAKTDIEDMLRNVSSDNVIFKSTLREAWAAFIQEVKNEVNIFEGNIDSTVALFQKDIESNYATLSEDVHTAITENLNTYNEKLDEMEATFQAALNAFKEVIEARVENYNENYAQAFSSFQLTSENNRAAFEAEIRNALSEHIQTCDRNLNQWVQNTMQNIGMTINQQNAKISDAEAYMKTNLAASLESMVTEMESNGEVNDIVKNIITANMQKRLEVINDAEATEGTVDLANFAGQGKSENIYGVAIHNYTDSPAVRVDNVGTGSVLQLVNARNPVRRPDKPESFNGSGNPIYYMVQNDANGDGTTESYPLWYMTKDGQMYWTGWSHAEAGSSTRNAPVKFVTNKNDGGTWAYVFEAAQHNSYVLNLMSGGVSLMQILMKDTEGNSDLSFPNGVNITSAKQLNLIGNEYVVIQTNGAIPNGFRVRYGTDYLYPVYANRFCTSTNRPTDNVAAGEIFMETDTNRTIRRNAANNGWVDMNGAAI